MRNLSIKHEILRRKKFKEIENLDNDLSVVIEVCLSKVFLKMLLSPIERKLKH